MNWKYLAMIVGLWRSSQRLEESFSFMFLAQCSHVSAFHIRKEMWAEWLHQLASHIDNATVLQVYIHFTGIHSLANIFRWDKVKNIPMLKSSKSTTGLSRTKCCFYSWRDVVKWRQNDIIVRFASPFKHHTGWNPITQKPHWARMKCVKVS